MKARLIFDLDDLDDRTAHLRCIKALDLALFAGEVQNILRQMWERFDDQEPRDDELRGYHRLLRQAFEQYGIEPDELAR